jgi:uncharacterized DUF497 family protein
VATVISGDFEWDDAKAEQNVRKHGVSFDEAASAFFDPAHLVLDDPKYDGRSWLIGFSHQARLLLFVHVDRGVRVRIVSARKAEKHEAKLYREG